MNSKNLVLVVILVLAAIGISLFILRGPETTRKWTVEESRIIAENFIMNSPTYKFDGFNLRYVETQTMRCPYCGEFVFEFQSRHSGYGDRTGKILLQVITEHKARVVVDHGKVVSAILDEKWDELNQGFLKEFGITECAKDSDCGTGGCSGQVCTTAEKAMGIITTCEFLPEYECLRLTSCGCIDGKCRWGENSAYRNCMDKLTR